LEPEVGTSSGFLMRRGNMNEGPSLIFIFIFFNFFEWGIQVSPLAKLAPESESGCSGPAGILAKLNFDRD
jgi:hypothetical protein